MSYYPIFVDLSGRKAVVVGGGAVAERKIDALLGCGAVVHVISRDLSSGLQDRLKNGEIELISREYDDRYIEGAFMVISATGDRELNRRVSLAASGRNILVNAVDQPGECSFIVPSVIKRGHLSIAVSTSGKSPALARRIKEALADRFGTEYEYFLNLMARIRKQILSADLSEDERGRIFHELVDSPILESIRSRDFSRAAFELGRILGREFSREDIIDYIKEK